MATSTTTGPARAPAASAAPVLAVADPLDYFYPALRPIMPGMLCPTCNKSLEDMYGKANGQNHVERKYFSHTVDCARTAAIAAAFKQLVERFGPASIAMFASKFACPCCTSVYKTTNEGRAAYKHIRRHADGSTAATFICRLCKQVVLMTLDGIVVHLAVCHLTWIVSASVDPVTKGELRLEHFNGLVPQYDVEEERFIVDPVELEEVMAARLQELEADRKAVAQPIALRNDVEWAERAPQIAAGQPKPILDKSYVAEEVRVDCAMTQYGLCPVCVWDERKTAAERMKGYTVKGLKMHFRNHIFDLYKAARAQPDEPVLQSHSCKDPICIRFDVAQDVTLLEFANHNVQIHWISLKPLPSGVLSGSRKNVKYGDPKNHVFLDEAELASFLESKEADAEQANAKKRIPGAKPRGGSKKKNKQTEEDEALSDASEGVGASGRGKKSRAPSKGRKRKWNQQNDAEESDKDEESAAPRKQRRVAELRGMVDSGRANQIAELAADRASKERAPDETADGAQTDLLGADTTDDVYRLDPALEPALDLAFDPFDDAALNAALDAVLDPAIDPASSANQPPAPRQRPRPRLRIAQRIENAEVDAEDAPLHTEQIDGDVQYYA